MTGLVLQSNILSIFSEFQFPKGTIVKKMAVAAALALVGLSPGSAFADTYTGKITLIQINDTGSMDFRVAMDVPMTNCSLNFAFVDRTSGLFNAYIAGLSTAYSLGKTVSLQVNREASGFCRIYFAQY